MSQAEVFEILARKVRRGQITRRQFTRTASPFSFGTVMAPVEGSASSAMARVF